MHIPFGGLNCTPHELLFHDAYSMSHHDVAIKQPIFGNTPQIEHWSIQHKISHVRLPMLLILNLLAVVVLAAR